MEKCLKLGELKNQKIDKNEYKTDYYLDLLLTRPHVAGIKDCLKLSV